ncbi:MAG TPA: substrate-binding domain-containing protein [Bauldia sp.]|nr:substrate-binding domain-containing protein [Bauldia sp.]
MTSAKTLIFAFAALSIAAGPALADKKQLAIVVKGRDDPAYAVIGEGCARWNADNKDSDYECLYTGPASALDRKGELQIVDDLITTGAAAIAVAPSDPVAMAELLKAKSPAMPILTIESDLAEADRGLRRTFVTVDERQVGVKLAELVGTWKPSGKICIQFGKGDSAVGNARAAGLRETLAGAAGVTSLSGQHGWTEVTGCPLYSDGDPAVANKQINETLIANPDLDALVLLDAAALTAPAAYARAIDPAKARLKDKSLVVVAADTPNPVTAMLKAGTVRAQVGEARFSLGYVAPSIMLDAIAGRTLADPALVGVTACTTETLATCTNR